MFLKFFLLNLEQLLDLDFIIRNFNTLVEKNALNQGLRLPEIKNVYANNPFAFEKTSKKTKRKDKENKQSRKTEPKSFKEQSPLRKNISTVYENTNLTLTKEIKVKQKNPHSNQNIRKMKDSFEKVKLRKKEFELNEALFPQLISLNPEFKNQMIPFPQTYVPKSLKFLKKNINKKEIKNITETDNANESHFIDLNNETKFPAIEKSRITTFKENTLDSFATERAISSILDKKFVTRNVSFNQLMINKIKSENPQFRNNRIISLKEIHQKYVLI